MSLVSVSEALASALAVKRHIVCFVGPSNEQVTELLSEAREGWQEVEFGVFPVDVSGLVLVRYPAGLVDVQVQDNFARWLYEIGKRDAHVALLCQENPSGMIPYLRHQFWYACGENVGAAADLLPQTKESWSGCQASIHVHHSIKRYILDLVVHLRMQRLGNSSQAAGIHSRSLPDMVLLCKWIAYCSKSSFVTANMVQTASIRYFPWHLQLIESSAQDPSVMYGSQEELVDELIARFDKFGLKMAEEYKNPLFKQLCVVKSVMKKVIPAT